MKLKRPSARTLERILPLLPQEERDRLDRYLLADRGHGTDIFGLDPQGFATAYAVGLWLHENWFRVASAGHENLPERGGAVLVSNHSGVLPYDALMIGTDVFRHTDPPRLVRYMVDYFAYSLPFIGVFFRSIGQVPGTRRNFDGLIEEGHLVGIFPEGAHALGKPTSEHYKLRPFGHGHVELAARHGVPVVPLGVVGAEEQLTMLADLKPLARALRLPYIPITTTLGVPKPVRYYIHYGPPLDIDPDVLRSVEVRSREVNRVREAVEDQLRVGLAVRTSEREGRA